MTELPAPISITDLPHELLARILLDLDIGSLVYAIKSCHTLANAAAGSRELLRLNPPRILPSWSVITGNPPTESTEKLFQIYYYHATVQLQGIEQAADSRELLLTNAASQSLDFFAVQGAPNDGISWIDSHRYVTLHTTAKTYDDKKVGETGELHTTSSSLLVKMVKQDRHLAFTKGDRAPKSDRTQVAVPVRLVNVVRSTAESSINDIGTIWRTSVTSLVGVPFFGRLELTEGFSAGFDSGPLNSGHIGCRLTYLALARVFRHPSDELKSALCIVRSRDSFIGKRCRHVLELDNSHGTLGEWSVVAILDGVKDINSRITHVGAISVSANGNKIACVASLKEVLIWGLEPHDLCQQPEVTASDKQLATKHTWESTFEVLRADVPRLQPVVIECNGAKPIKLNWNRDFPDKLVILTNRGLQIWNLAYVGNGRREIQTVGLD